MSAPRTASPATPDADLPMNGHPTSIVPEAKPKPAIKRVLVREPTAAHVEEPPDAAPPKETLKDVLERMHEHNLAHPPRLRPWPEQDARMARLRQAEIERRAAAKAARKARRAAGTDLAPVEPAPAAAAWVETAHDAEYGYREDVYGLVVDLPGIKSIDVVTVVKRIFDLLTVKPVMPATGKRWRIDISADGDKLLEQLEAVLVTEVAARAAKRLRSTKWAVAKIEKACQMRGKADRHD